MTSRNDSADVEASLANANETVRANRAILTVVEKVPDLPQALPLGLLPASIIQIKRAITTLAGSQFIEGTLGEEALAGWLRAYAELGRFVPETDVSLFIDKLAEAIVASRQLDTQNPEAVREWGLEYCDVLHVFDTREREMTSNVELNKKVLLREFQEKFMTIIQPTKSPK